MLSPIVLIVPFKAARQLHPEQPLEAQDVYEAIREAKELAPYYDGVGVFMVMVDSETYAPGELIEVMSFGEVPQSSDIVPSSFLTVAA